MKGFIQNVRESIGYGIIIFRNRSFSSKIGMGKISYGNFQFFDRIRKYLLPKGDFLVIDVGANDGWFAKIFLNLIPNIEVISFEPLLSQNGPLKELANRYKNFKYFLTAVGEIRETKKIQEFGTTGLSSLRPLTDGSYKENQFNTNITNSYDVDVIALDDFADLKVDNKNVILKIDTQGYELEVLKGSKRLFEEQKIDVVVVELMTKEKYKGQALGFKIIDFLNDYDFELFDVSPSGYDTTNGQMTEFDAVFIRKGFL